MTAWKFAVDCPAISSTVAPRTAARLSTTFATNAGSLRLPRNGTGARYGESVSTRNRSGGTIRATSRRSPGTEVERRASHFHPSGETVKHDAPAGGVVAEGLKRVVGGLAGMDDDGQIPLRRQLELPPEDFLLNRTGREVVVVVEPDLSEGHRAVRVELGVQPGHRRIEIVAVLPGLVRMDTD